LLAQESTYASDREIGNIFVRIQEIDNKIEALQSRGGFGTALERLRQLERLWLDWAVRHYPEGKPEKPRLSAMRDAIAYKPELLEAGARVQDEPDNLMQSLQNLTVQLQRLTQSLS